MRSIELEKDMNAKTAYKMKVQWRMVRVDVNATDMFWVVGG